MNTAVDELAIRESRRKFLGGSDISALLGIAPANWKRNTPLALYLDKIEPPVADTQNLGVKRRGKRWESVVAEMLIEELQSKDHKIEIVSNNKRYIDPDVDYFACEIDFEIKLDGEDDITNVELKTVHPFAASDWGESGTDSTPVWYTAQCVWGLGVTRRRRTILAPLFGADEIRTFPIEADPALIADIRETARKFWTENVLARVPPPPGGLVDLARLFPKDVGTSIEATDLKVIDALVELRDVKDRIKLLEADKDEREFIIKGFMKDASTLTVGGKKACSWKHQVANRVDLTALREARPEIAQQFTKQIDSRVFRLS